MGIHQSLLQDSWVNPQSFVYGDIIQEIALQYLTHKFDHFIVSGTRMPPGLKIYFTGTSDKMSGDVEFGSDICPMTFSSVLTRK